MSDITVAKWPLDQMLKVARLFTALTVDHSLLEQSEQGGPVHEEAARALRHEAHALAVEIDERDTTWTKVDEDFRGAVFRCSWWPTVRQIECLRGPSDGRLVEVGKGGEPWRILNPDRPVMLEPDATAPWHLEERDTLYVVAGWNETERRWVYSPS